MINDRTKKIEDNVQNELKPRFIHLVKLFCFVFRSAKTISIIYLGLFIILSLMRPVLAFIWGSYIQTAENYNHIDSIVPMLLLIFGYFIINFLIDLLNMYLIPSEDIQRLDLVQANHQQELLLSKMYVKINSILLEVLEIPSVNDKITQVFNFIGSKWGGMNTTVMMNGYITIARSVSVISIATSLYILNPWLCFIVLVAPLPTIWSLTAGLKLRFKFVKDNTKLLRKASYFQNLMLSSAGKELKTLGLYDFIFDKWKNVINEYTIKEKDVIRTRAIIQIFNSFLLSLANILSSIFAIILMVTGRITLGSLGVALSLVSVLISDTKEMLAGFITVYMKKNEAAQFFDFINLPEQKNEGEKINNFEYIELKNIKYRYPLTNKYVINNIDIRINKGEKVALVGENGMGKSTFVKLITGLLTPSQGTLYINGISFEKINPYDWHDIMSVMVQDSERYVTFSVSDNVYLGDTAKPRIEKEINEAIKFSGLNDVDKDVLLGKDMGGIDLSGGQWQKLAIARSSYRNRQLIILDEPTSNLDPFAEMETFKKFIELTSDKTFLFVTHRISAASLADRIIVFSNGKIVQDGTHDELIINGGEYARLYNEQAKWYDR